jgi:23S rRNA pseudouridine2605 synthase
MFEALGYHVTGLLRVEFAGLTLEGLRPGQWRFLKKSEVKNLEKLTASD